MLLLLKPIFPREGINDNGDDDHPGETRLASPSSSYSLGFDLISITYFSVDFVFLTCRCAESGTPGHGTGAVRKTPGISKTETNVALTLALFCSLSVKFVDFLFRISYRVVVLPGTSCG